VLERVPVQGDSTVTPLRAKQFARLYASCVTFAHTHNERYRSGQSFGFEWTTKMDDDLGLWIDKRLQAARQPHPGPFGSHRFRLIATYAYGGDLIPNSMRNAALDARRRLPAHANAGSVQVECSAVHELTPDGSFGWHIFRSYRLNDRKRINESLDFHDAADGMAEGVDVHLNRAAAVLSSIEQNSFDTFDLEEMMPIDTLHAILRQRGIKEGTVSPVQSI
jgi:hypothetical protein